MDVELGARMFAARTVAAAYRERPAYPLELYDALAALCSQNGTVVDLGCGTGKIARALAPRCERVIAIDPSQAMIETGRAEAGGRAANIDWRVESAETATLPNTGVALWVAAASVHWMDHDQVFPRLHAIAPDAPFAVDDGDGAHAPAWEDAWQAFLQRWVPRITGVAHDAAGNGAFTARMNAYRRWLDVRDDRAFLGEEVEQRVDAFITCQHSRATFAPARLGAHLQAFREELRAMLTPFAENDLLRYRVRSTLVVGRVRATPADDAAI